MNQRHIAADSRTYRDSSCVNGEILSKLALTFVKSTSAVGSWSDSPHKFERFGLSSRVSKVNRIPLYNLFFDKS